MTSDIRRLSFSFLISVVIFLIFFALLGRFWILPRRSLPPRPPLLVTLLPAPPKTPPRPKPVDPGPPSHSLPMPHPKSPAPARSLPKRSPARASRPRVHVNPSVIKHPEVGHPAPVNPIPVPQTLPSAPKPIMAIPAPEATKVPTVPSVPDVPPSPPAPTQTAGAETQPSGTSVGQDAGNGTSDSGTGSGAKGSGEGGGGGGGGPFGIGGGGGTGLRHIVYVLDISPSMESRIARARQELHEALATLQSNETFDIIAFGGRTVTFSPNLVAASPDLVAQADQFLDNVPLRPGTNLDAALTQALALPNVEEVVVLTDGVPTVGETDFKKLARLIQRRNISHARIDTIGLVGKNPDGTDDSFEATQLLQQIAQDSGGQSRLVSLGVATP